MTLHIDSTLQGGKYRILSVLGQGGFGITYLAEQTLLDGKVAIKEFFMKELCERDEGTSHVTLGTSSNREMVEKCRQKFLKEARTIFRLNHPNIVRILDVFEENGTAYYVMDFIEGESLADMVKRRGALPEAEALNYVKEVGKALMYIHEKKINHLDIKPSNIMRRKDDGRIMLIDFGVSKQYDLETSEGTSTTPVGISRGYSPAEQYRQHGVQTFSPQSDVYALAATLYKLLTGVTPPEAIEVQDEGLPLSKLQSRHISLSVIDAIQRAMKGRNERTQSISAFLSALDDATEKESEETEVVEVIPPKTEPKPKQEPQPDPVLPNEPTPPNPDPKPKFSFKIALGVAAPLLIGLLAIFFGGRGKSEVTPSSLDAEAMFNMGADYYYGRNGKTKDYTEAVKWYRKAAEQGHAGGQCTLGYMYDEGLGVPQDYTEAVKWYRKSAEQGVAEGQYNLGYMYDEGLGVPQDYTEAVKWYRKAAEQGDVEGQVNLGYMYRNGLGVPQDNTEAVKWYREAAEQGDAKGQDNLGYMYEKGLGVPQNYSEAFKWSEKAAAQGHADAQNRIGNFYQKGQGVEQDLAKAVEWYRKSAEQGNARGQSNLGYMYHFGLGVTRDYAEAVKWYRKAADQGYAQGQSNLGYMYYYGIGVPKDLNEAKIWFQKAAEQGHKNAKKMLEKL